jgi:O-acetyl-ADP-ribose deacetylase (regulator of RNase III)
MIRLIAGNITTFQGDVIVNAANNVGLGGGGVDGAIHRAAGPGLLEACRMIPICPNLSGLGPGMTPASEIRIPTGHVVVTPAFDLACRWVIHTAGPVWPEGDLPKESLLVQKTLRDLRDCYFRSLCLAHALGARSIAFPAISTGVYGAPMDACAWVALKAAKHWFSTDITFFIWPEEPNLTIWSEMAQDLEIEME